MEIKREKSLPVTARVKLMLCTDDRFFGPGVCELLERIREVWTAESDFFKVYTEDVAAMLDDIDDFVRSYNWEDCDGSIDYFNVNFYYFGCKPDWKFKIVPKKARIGKSSSRKDIAVA